MAGAFSPRWPMGYLETFGPRADPVTALAWGLTALSCAVVIIVALLVVAGVIARRQRTPEAPASAPVLPDEGGMRWIQVGVGLTLVALIATLVWTVAVAAAVDSPAAKPALTLQIAGHQWWWEVTYDPDKPGRTFVTANEIHVPVGRPVEVKLTGADVIHSFWIPALTGKTDTIPGRTNIAWLQADKPGIYRGQCTEYCGKQHAHMAVYVVADPPAVFEQWRAAQLKPAAAPANPDAAQGAAVFQARCSACHTVRGTEAGGVTGPDLTHLMSRQTIAAGTLPNNPLSLSGWVANPQALKPGAQMPATWLSGAELADLRSYLETLR